MPGRRPTLQVTLAGAAVDGTDRPMVARAEGYGARWPNSRVAGRTVGRLRHAGSRPGAPAARSR